MGGLDQIFRVRHHAKNITILVDDTGDIIDGTVGVCAFCITKHHLPIVFQLLERFTLGKIIAVMMRDRATYDFALPVLPGKNRVGIGDFKLNLLADEFERGIAHQRARQETGFNQNLEAIAHAKHAGSTGGLAPDRLHDRHARGDGATAQIIAVGKATGYDDQIDIGNLGFGLPDGYGGLAGDFGQCSNHVPVTVQARKE